MLYPLYVFMVSFRPQVSQEKHALCHVWEGGGRREEGGGRRGKGGERREEGRGGGRGNDMRKCEVSTDIHARMWSGTLSPIRGLPD